MTNHTYIYSGLANIQQGETTNQDGFTSTNSVIDTSQLTLELETHPIISINFLRVDTRNADLLIIFSQTLAVENKTILDDIVKNHVSDDTSMKISDRIRFVGLNHLVDTEVWRRYDVAIYEGTRNVPTIHRISVIGEMDDTCTSYSVKIFDLTNKKIMVEKEFTNMDPRTINVIKDSEIQNVPYRAAILSAQVKKTGSSGSAYVYNITIHLKYKDSE